MFGYNIYRHFVAELFCSSNIDKFSKFVLQALHIMPANYNPTHVYTFFSHSLLIWRIVERVSVISHCKFYKVATSSACKICFTFSRKLSFSVFGRGLLRTVPIS